MVCYYTILSNRIWSYKIYIIMETSDKSNTKFKTVFSLLLILCIFFFNLAFDVYWNVHSYFLC